MKAFLTSLQGKIQGARRMITMSERSFLYCQRAALSMLLVIRTTGYSSDGVKSVDAFAPGTREE